MQITIDPEFRDLLRPLTQEEHLHLTSDILDNGCRDPLVVWGDILLDGHNRYEICTRNRKEFTTVAAPDWIKSRADAIKWIIDNQKGKRNLTKAEFEILMGKYYNTRKKEVGEHEGNQHTQTELPQSEAVPRTSEQVAKEFGVSHATVERAGKKAEQFDALPSEEKREILEGKRKLPATEKPKAKKDTMEEEMIIETLRGVAREIEDCLDILDAATKGKIKTICMRIMEKM